MRNLFKRQPRPTDKPTLRERLAATRNRLGRTLRAQPALNTLVPTPEPVPDRAALVNYATFLSWERNRACAELYPHLGPKAVGFVPGMNAAERFFHGRDGRSRPDLPPASTRAAAVLDLVGIDWRSDPPGDGIERSIGARENIDTGGRSRKPYGWPAIDAGLTSALAELRMLDAAMAALMKGHDRDAEDVPGYGDLDDARLAAIETLERDRAQGLAGLQAKAAALQVRTIAESSEDTGRVAQSLARDLLAGGRHTIEPQPDPIFAAINECRRLMKDGDDALTAARDELLQIVPATGAGCCALARFAVEFFEDQGRNLEDADGAVLDLIARSPAL